MGSFFSQLPSISLRGTPIEIANRLAHLHGFVFFDSALPHGAAISLLAAEPLELLTGDLRADAETFDTVSNRFPDSLLAGWVEYDGAFQFGRFTEALLFDHGSGTWFGSERLAAKLAQEALPPPKPAVQLEPVTFEPTQSREDFQQAVCRALAYIRDGHIYQVNLSQQFTAKFAPSAPRHQANWALYQALRRVSPAPYASYLGFEQKQLFSSSPECFLEMRDRQIRTRPIKGTRPRHPVAQRDLELGAELVASPKERAELLMITDLLRNDLGQVCEYGSVHVPALLQLERFPQVHHLVSTVEGRLRPQISHSAALRACFPGGSISGAPKKRACEIIAELEPVPRGLYTGAIGWFAGGDSRFSIAIRTLVREGDLLHFHTGAGIVTDSNPEAEFAETLHKAAGIFAATSGQAGEPLAGQLTA